MTTFVYNNQKKENKYDCFAAIAIIALMFIPLSSTGYGVRIIIVSLLIVYKMFNGGINKVFSNEIGKIIYLMLFGCVASIITMLIMENYINYLLLQHEITRMLFNVLLFILIPRLRIPFEFIYRSSIVVLFFHTTIQLIQKTRLFDINTWIRQVYLKPEIIRSHLTLSELTGADFRSGSIFLNPNVYMVIPCMVLCIIFQKNIITSEKKNYLYSGIVLISLLLTGSRTTLFVFIAIAILYLFGNNTITVKEKSILFMFIGIAVIFFLLFGIGAFSTLRIFKIGNSIEGSFGVKLSNIFEYIKSSNIIYYIWGSLGATSVNDIQLDMELGYIFKYYGLIGLIWYYKLIILNPKRHNNNTFFYRSSCMTIILIALSATIFFCMPVFPFVCLLTMADMY